MNAMAVLLILYLAGWAFSLWRAKTRRSTGPIANWLAYQGLILLALMMLLPFYWMVTNSFKPAEEAGRFPPTLWPEGARLSDVAGFFGQIAENYRDAWNSPPGGMSFGRYFWVSFVTGALTTVGVLLTSILAAYAFAKMKFIGKSAAFYLVLATLMVPPQVLMIPDYLILERFGWLDRYHALIIPFLASVFAIFLLRQFFMTIPDDLWDAAQIDGASRSRFLWAVMVPLSRPILIAVAIFTFLGQWNALMWPLIATSRPHMRTLMVGLQGFNEEAAAEPNLLMAAATLSMLPIIVAFFFLQRFFIQSVTRTGLKG